MANEDLDAVADIAVAANDAFKRANAGADTSVGVISQTIRAMGIAADAVNIDCRLSGQRLVLILLDHVPGMVGIGIGQKDEVGNYELIRQVALEKLQQAEVLEILEARFETKAPASHH